MSVGSCAGDAGGVSSCPVASGWPESRQHWGHTLPEAYFPYAARLLQSTIHAAKVDRICTSEGLWIWQAAQELRIGVIGAGGRGSLARHAHKPEEGVRVVAGADVDPRRPRKVQGVVRAGVSSGRRTTASCWPRPMSTPCFVTSPDFLHEEHAVAALEAGKHVYLEKPMAITIEGCDRILQAAYDHKVKLYCGHNMRHMAFIRKMKELITSGQDRRAEGRLVPALRRLRRRRLLQGLARRAAIQHQPAAAEGRARHRHAALALRRLHAARHRDGQPDRLQPDHRQAQARRETRRQLASRRTGRRWPRRG